MTTADDQGRIHELFTSRVFEHVVNELSLFQMQDLMKPKKVLEQLWYPHPMGKLTWADMSSLWLLIQRDEFIKLQLLQSMKHIPKVYGFCGRFYAVEKVEALEELTFTPFRKPMPWKKRLKIALDFLSLEKEFSNSSLGKLHHCDIQPGNFGITKDMRVVALDVDTVFLTRQMKDFLEQPTCDSNKQCDFFDCVSSCNQTIHQCSRNILTNNLQVRKVLITYHLLNQLGVIIPEGVGEPPIMAYMGRLCSKEVPFSGFRYMKGQWFHQLKYTPISIKVAHKNYVSEPKVHYGKPFCSRKVSLVHVHWNNGDHLREGVQEGF